MNRKKQAEILKEIDKRNYVKFGTLDKAIKDFKKKPYKVVKKNDLDDSKQR